MAENRIRLPVDVDFFRDHEEELWQKNYQILKEYFTKNGHSRVLYNDPILAIGFNHLEEQRSQALWQRTHPITDECNFNWDPIEDEWQKNYQLLKEVMQNWRSSYKVNPPPAWSLGLHSKGEKSKQKISQERVRLLDDLGFIWDINEHKWQEKYKFLKEYFDQHGDTQVPQNHPVIGKWVSKQRSDLKADKLSVSKNTSKN